ncbi:MAG: hypothetical protein HFH86_01400 [Bacilli bacterium]|jgi:hypothetical protein|nr:hypothetical protein [Bacilli bacterium]
MLNKNEISERIIQIYAMVKSYIQENMTDTFKIYMYNAKGSTATFKTEKGNFIRFTARNNPTGQLIEVYSKGKINTKPFEFEFKNAKDNPGSGSLILGSYKINFSNIENEKKEISVNPIKNILGLQLTNRELQDKINSLTESLLEDIKTMTPTEESKEYLKQKLSSNDSLNHQTTSPMSKREKFYHLKEQLQLLKNQRINNLNENGSLKK